MGVIATLLVTTALAGVAGTGLGGVIGAMLQKDSKRAVSLLLSFAGGVMLSVVCFDLVTEAIAMQVGLWVVVGSIAFGVAVTYFLNYLIDRKTNPEVPHIDADHPKTADDLDELIHSDHLEQHYARKDSKMGLFVAGVVMACAIALHNVPEGLTIGASHILPTFPKLHFILPNFTTPQNRETTFPPKLKRDDPAHDLSKNTLYKF